MVSKKAYFQTPIYRRKPKHNPNPKTKTKLK